VESTVSEKWEKQIFPSTVPPLKNKSKRRRENFS
jgi:hypothetical protein